MNLDELKKLAGINEFTGLQEYNISHTANDLLKKEKELNIKPGDPDWFKLWFSKPYLTGPVSFRGRKK